MDNAPSHQQESANAWASRMTGVGNVLGYVFGYLNLPRYFHFFGNTQFKVLVVIASIFLTVTVSISLFTIKERNPQLDPPSNTDNENGGFVGFFKQVFNSIKHLPPQTRKVCEIQFFHGYSSAALHNTRCILPLLCVFTAPLTPPILFLLVLKIRLLSH